MSLKRLSCFLVYFKIESVEDHTPFSLSCYILQAQVGDPTFKILSTLTGQRYHEHLIPNSYNDATVTVDVAKVVARRVEKLCPQTVYA